MAETQPARADIEIGGMQWKVTPPDELSAGRQLEMVCFEDFGSTPDYPMNDVTTVIKTDDGEVHLAVDRLRNQSRYTDTLVFEPGTLRAIIDHVEATGTETEQSSSTGGRSIFSRIMESLTSHASHLSLRR